MLVPAFLLMALAAVMIYYGIRLLLAGRRSMKLGRASMQWPTAPGQVTASAVQFVDEGGDPPTGYYLPVVAYTYAVEGAAYAGTAIAYRDLRSLQKTAQAIVAKYPVGSDVAVTYDPLDPRNGLLEPGTVGVRWLYFWAVTYILIGVVIAALSIAIPAFNLI